MASRLELWTWWVHKIVTTGLCYFGERVQEVELEHGNETTRKVFDVKSVGLSTTSSIVISGSLCGIWCWNLCLLYHLHFRH
eukprot:78539-Amphidinium_carterae.1